MPPTRLICDLAPEGPQSGGDARSATIVWRQGDERCACRQELEGSRQDPLALQAAGRRQNEGRGEGPFGRLAKIQALRRQGGGLERPFRLAEQGRRGVAVEEDRRRHLVVSRAHGSAQS